MDRVDAGAALGAVPQDEYDRLLDAAWEAIEDVALSAREVDVSHIFAKPDERSAPGSPLPHEAAGARPVAPPENGSNAPSPDQAVTDKPTEAAALAAARTSYTEQMEAPAALGPDLMDAVTWGWHAGLRWHRGACRLPVVALPIPGGNRVGRTLAAERELDQALAQLPTGGRYMRLPHAGMQAPASTTGAGCHLVRPAGVLRCEAPRKGTPVPGRPGRACAGFVGRLAGRHVLVALLDGGLRSTGAESLALTQGCDVLACGRCGRLHVVRRIPGTGRAHPHP